MVSSPVSPAEVVADSYLDAKIDAVVLRASRAQELFENWSDERIDGLLLDVAMTVAANAEPLAIATVAETGLGNVADKTLKNRFASLTVYESLAGKVARGRLSFDAARQIRELARPVGVMFAIVPVTSPVETAIFKTLIALKGRNALILSFPREALGVGQFVGNLIRDVLAAAGAPNALVQCVRYRSSPPSREPLRRDRRRGPGGPAR